MQSFRTASGVAEAQQRQQLLTDFLEIATQISLTPAERSELLGPPKDAVFAMLGNRWTPESDPEDHFDTCFEHLRAVVRAIRQVAKSPHPNLTVERLEPVHFSYDELADGTITNFQAGLFESQDLESSLSDEDEELVHEHLMEAHHKGPAALVRDLTLDAYNAAHVEGDYGGAVLRSATAAEVLARNTSAVLAWEATTSSAGACRGPIALSLAMRPNTAPVRLIAEILLPELGGEWNPLAPGTATSEWRTRIAHDRNRVVHSGYSPSRQEARAAVESVNILTEHVHDRLVASAQRYPRSALILGGRRELERRGAWGKVRATAQGGPGIDSWLLEFSDWVDSNLAR